MEYTTLGQTGLRVSRLCLGCMTFGEAERGHHAGTLGRKLAAADYPTGAGGGIHFFDTANSHSDGCSEEIVGRALKTYARRDEVVVATKVFFLTTGLSRANILQSIDDSLTCLGMDYVDLLQIHRWDYDTPLEETLEALHDVVQSGKARFYRRLLDVPAWQFARALYTGWTRFVSMQDQYNLIQREEEREMHPLCLAENIAVLPWSPLAQGRLTRPWGETTARLVSDEFAKRSMNKAKIMMLVSPNGWA